MNKAVLFLTLSLFLFGGIVFISFLCIFIEGLKLSIYLKKNNYERWRHLTSIGNFGPGLSNPFRGFSYLYSNQDDNDGKILRLKDSIRIKFRYANFSALAFLINFCIFLILATSSQ